MRRLLKFLTYSIVGLVVVSATALIYLRNCEWNPELAAEYATRNAEKRSAGLCALYVRKAINAGGCRYLSVEVRGITNMCCPFSTSIR